VAELRFGVLVLPDAAFPALAERWRRVEDLEFDFIFAPDHSRHTRDSSLTWFEGWTTPVAMALSTRSIRIGTLVSNPVLRGPTLLAKAAHAVDQLSGGRLELGLGMGVEVFDHREMGEAVWPAAERAARFREYVEIVDGVLRSWAEPFSFEGSYHRTWEAALAPAPVQRPRPPLTVGGRSPTVLSVAAERADCWSTYGLPGEGSMSQIAETTRRRNAELDERCAALGRDPATLRRSLVLWSPLDPWESSDAFERICDAFRAAGIAEFIVMWPDEDRLPLLERASATIASLRASSGNDAPSPRAAVN
jgi:alkanesulfonate monooxygenase SsuD/methylene tetrahydromethanopterin reductase-like flavin-dependent oxidoreductase (luciferase family)